MLKPAPRKRLTPVRTASTKVARFSISTMRTDLRVNRASRAEPPLNRRTWWPGGGTAREFLTRPARGLIGRPAHRCTRPLRPRRRLDDFRTGRITLLVDDLH